MTPDSTSCAACRFGGQPTALFCHRTRSCRSIYSPAFRVAVPQYQVPHAAQKANVQVVRRSLSEPWRSTPGGCIASTMANGLFTSTTMPTSTCPCSRGCSTGAAADTRRSDTPYSFRRAQFPAGQRTSGCPLTRSGSGTIQGACAASSETASTAHSPVCSCTRRDRLRLTPTARPGHAAPPSVPVPAP